MTIQSPPNLQELLTRLEAILQELESIRRQLQAYTEAPAKAGPETSWTDMLWGAAGQGTPEEYDFDLEWKRFEE